MLFTWNSSTKEVETGDSELQSYPWLYIQILSDIHDIMPQKQNKNITKPSSHKKNPKES